MLKIYRDKAFANIALQEAYSHPQKNTIVKIVNGVLEHHFLLQYYINKVTTKQPHQAIRILLAQGIYCIKILQMKSSPVLRLALEVAQDTGKDKLGDFIIYVLNKVQEDIPLPKSKHLLEQIQLNAPIWLISQIKQDYPKAYKRILQAKADGTIHLRLKNEKDAADFEKANPMAERTACGYFTKITDNVKSYLKKGRAFAQSLTSGYAVLACGNVQGRKVLDMCAAPGGKSVYLAQRGAFVTACDIYGHKLELIKKYASKAEVDITTALQDGTIHNSLYVDAFDCVLVDAPCSGTGVMAKRQDIRFSKQPQDIASLVSIQEKLLVNAANYVKGGGYLVYSTCSILKVEGEQLIADFLAKNTNFVLKTIEGLPYNNQGMLQFLPDGKLDGFFIARIQKV